MKRGATFNVLAFGGALALLGAVRAPADYRLLDSDAEPLRTAFNTDAGKVRVLALVAPT
jgi:hypothetical protein